MERNCAHCNILFTAGDAKQKYCTPKCRRTVNNRLGNARERRKTAEKIKNSCACVVCGTEFLAIADYNKYCSKKCRLKQYLMDKRRPQVKAKRVCAFCRKEFEFILNSGLQKKYCDDKCKRAYRYHYAGDKEYAINRALDFTSKKLCLVCKGPSPEGKRRCPTCSRKHTEALHYKRGSKFWILGSKHSPFKKDKTFNDLRKYAHLDNPLLAENWDSVKGWIAENIELFHESKVYQYAEIGDGLLDKIKELTKDPVEVSLEDYIIGEIDNERLVHERRELVY